MHHYIAAIDQGTTSSRVIIYRSDTLSPSASAQVEYENSAPHNGWLEVDANVLVDTVVECINKAASDLLSVDPTALLDSVGITNQRETVVVWDTATGTPLCPAIIWADARTATLVEEVSSELAQRHNLSGPAAGRTATVSATGLPVSTYFSAVKLRWLAENNTEVAAALSAQPPTCLVGTVDSWLIWRLTGGGAPLPLSAGAAGVTSVAAVDSEQTSTVQAALASAAAVEKACRRGGGVHVTDVTNASRTLLMSLSAHGGAESATSGSGSGSGPRWDPELCSLFRVPQCCLPTIVPSACAVGRVVGSAFSGAVIGGAVGDQQAALVGHGAVWGVGTAVGVKKATFGTGLFALSTCASAAAPAPSRSGLLTTVAFAAAESVFDSGTPTASEGAVGGPGAAAGEEGGAVADALWASAKMVYAREGAVSVAGSGVRWLVNAMCCAASPAEVSQLAATVDDSGGVVFVPAFSGLLAPHWRADARGALVGLSTATTRAHVCRAMLEAVAFQCAEVLAAMDADDGEGSERDGKAAAGGGGAEGDRASVQGKRVVDLTVGCRKAGVDDGRVSEQLLGWLEGSVGERDELRVDGGMCSSDVFLQILADTIGRRVVCSGNIEVTARGAAVIAGVGGGTFATAAEAAAAASHGSGDDRTFMPHSSTAERVRSWCGVLVCDGECW